MISLIVQNLYKLNELMTIMNKKTANMDGMWLTLEAEQQANQGRWQHWNAVAYWRFHRADEHSETNRLFRSPIVFFVEKSVSLWLLLYSFSTGRCHSGSVAAGQGRQEGNAIGDGGTVDCRVSSVSRWPCLEPGRLSGAKRRRPPAAPAH